MGLENIRRWPIVIVLAVCLMLMISLLNSWTLEAELRNELFDLSTQLKACSKQQSTCLEESLTLLEQKDGYEIKAKDLVNEKEKLSADIKNYKNKSADLESQVKHSLEELKTCQTELESSKNLQVSMSATLEALRFKNTKLTDDYQVKVKELESEIAKLKMALTTKGTLNVSKSITPIAPVPKLSPSLNDNNPINEPVIENAAKEEFGDADFESNIQ